MDEYDQYGMQSSNMSAQMLMSDEERKSLRASASPFYPDKFQDKITFSMQESIEKIREHGGFLEGIKKLLDNLGQEEKSQVVQHLSGENIENFQDVEQYKIILEEIKADRTKLRNSNK
jgi:hypothetical protein